ncbi:MAG: putative signal transduction histidine kinase [Bacteroidetes bacterium]|nr:MAG: putative signal transduction histidine kinase [Bacteroidota bacterium]
MREPKDFSFEPDYKYKPDKREVLTRVIGILVISVLFPVIRFDNPSTDAGFLKIVLVSLVCTALLWNGSMLIINYSVSKFSVFREPVKLLVIQVISLALFVVGVESGNIWAIEHFLGVPMNQGEKVSFVATGLLITFMISAIYASVSFFLEWKSNMLKTQALEKANMEARYETLRNQVNPHFLFNSLNTLLMLVNDNPVASRYVESVSEFMRYMLNSREKEVVLLRDEIKMAREFVYIQQSRFGEKLSVSFDVQENFFHYAVPPLALQMLIENALKHNVISRDNPLHVKVYVADDSWLVVENNIQPKIDKEPSTGVGLANIRDRYLFLSGKEVIVKQKDNKFVVMLPLFERQF